MSYNGPPPSNLSTPYNFPPTDNLASSNFASSDVASSNFASSNFASSNFALSNVAPSNFVPPYNFPPINNLLPASSNNDSAPPPINPNPSPAPIAPPHVVMIDRLVKRHRLTAEHKSELRGLYQIATKGPTALAHCDIMSRIYMLGCKFGSEKRLMDRLDAMEKQSQVDDVRGVVKELSVRLEDTWAITQEQRTNIRLLCQQQVHLPGRTSFKDLHNDVDAIIKAKPEKYRMENIVGRHNREIQLTALLRSTASNVRNTYRQELKASLYGKKKCGIDKFVGEQATRYHLSKSEEASQAQLIQYVLLRCYAREHEGVLDKAEPEEAGAPEQNGVESNGPPPAKKQKQGTSRGRIAEGQDFWSMVDEWFQEKVDVWGSDYGSDGWTEFVDKATKADHEFSKMSKPKKSTSKATKNGTVQEAGSEDSIASTAASSVEGPGEDSWLGEWDDL